MNNSSKSTAENQWINKIHCGNALDLLRQMPDNTVHCVVTSPPYWGLRDYGTAKWEGGDPNCEHVVGRATRGGLTDFQKNNKGSFADEAIRQGEKCPHCGAIRIDYQLGLEKTPEEYVQNLVDVFREVKRVLKKDGVAWINLGDSYMSSGGASRHHGYTDPKYKDGRKVEYFEPRVYPHPNIKPKDLVGIPWMVAFALRADGWWLRQDIIWAKNNPMPESVNDRCTKSHEYIFLLSKSQKYYFDADAIKEDSVSEESYKGRRFRAAKAIVKANARPFQNPNTLDKGNEADGKTYEKRNKRSVWTVNTKPFSGAHFATFPEMLIRDCVLAGCPENGIVLDPFMGAGTTAVVARKLNRYYVGIELNPEYIDIANRRINDELGLFK
jgi:DNA modification methylase